MQHNWGRCPTSESVMAEVAQLTGTELKYEFRQAVPISSLKIGPSKKNNARLEPVEEDVAARYAADMRKGDVFPATVILDNGLILAGNTRVKAAQMAGADAVAAYVICGITPGQQFFFVRRDNAKHGVPLSMDMQVETCAELHLTYGMPVKTLCDLWFGTALSYYNRIIDAVHARKVVAKLSGWKEISVAGTARSTLAALYPLLDSRHVLRGAADVVTRHGYSSAQTSALLASIKAKDNEADKLAVIEEDRRANEGRVKGTPRYDLDFKRELNRLLNFLETAANGKPLPGVSKIASDKKIAAELKGVIGKMMARLRQVKGG